MIVDINVVLDVLPAREPFAGAGSEVFALVGQSTVGASLCATTVTAVNDLLTRSLPRDEARRAL